MSPTPSRRTVRVLIRPAMRWDWLTSKLGQVRLEFAFRQPFAEEFVVAVFQDHRVIPDFGRHVDDAVQMLQAFAAEGLEPEGLTVRVLLTTPPRSSAV